jgi:excisionase family DNA binding protein
VSNHAQPDTVSSGIEPIFISVKQAAQVLSLTPWTIYKLLDDQKIASHYEGRRRLVSIESLREYAKNLPIYPSGGAA